MKNETNTPSDIRPEAPAKPSLRLEMERIKNLGLNTGVRAGCNISCLQTCAKTKAAD
jgi:hypothetical protein